MNLSCNFEDTFSFTEEQIQSQKLQKNEAAKNKSYTM